MSRAVQSQLYVLGFTLLIVGYMVIRRMRPQPVRPSRMVYSAVAIAAVVGLGLAGSAGSLRSDPLALVLIPVMAAAGVALGYYLIGSMSFWTDPATGALWMRGGALFALILVGTIVIRLGFRTVAFGSPFASGGGAGSGFAPQTNAGHGFLFDLSADLLFLTLGLWATRAYLLIQRHRAHAAALPTAPPATGPG